MKTFDESISVNNTVVRMTDFGVAELRKVLK